MNKDDVIVRHGDQGAPVKSKPERIVAAIEVISGEFDQITKDDAEFGIDLRHRETTWPLANGDLRCGPGLIAQAQRQRIRPGRCNRVGRK
jgi:hypothetical protein